MKQLLIYYSKNGTTLGTAKVIKNKLGDNCDIINIKECKNSFSKYDAFIIGSPIYAGRLPGAISRFMHKNNKDLFEKPVSFADFG